MSMDSHQVYVSVGANLGKRIYALEFAVQRLQSLAVEPLVCSPVYETTPVGVAEQPLFLNMVVGLHVTLGPTQLLAQLMDIEAEYGRTRTVRFGPRTLDLDILLYDNLYICYQSLQIPHPRMWERAFVLVPLAALVPNRPALGGRTVRQLADCYSQEREVRYVGRFW